MNHERAQLLEREVLPAYLARRRWFGAKDERIRSTRFVTMLPLTKAPVPLWHTELEVETRHGSQRYQFPLGVSLDEDITGPLAHQMACARVRRGSRVGFLTDAFVMKEYAQFLVKRLHGGESVSNDQVRLDYQGAPVDREWLDRTMATIDLDSVRWISEEQSNSSLVVDNTIIIKLFRRLTPGAHPEAEMARTLTERRYANISPLVGEVWRHGEGSEPCMLAVAQRYIDNQGDAWGWVVDRLQRRVTEPAAMQGFTVAGEGSDAEEPLINADLLGFASTLGQRLGELHRTLAQPSTDPAFAPEHADASDCKAWAQQVLELLERARERLTSQRDTVDAESLLRIDQILEGWPELPGLVEDLAAAGEDSLMMRIHGDLHLGQILLVQDDAFFIDFEGEPAATLTKRRAKHSPWRDVAGVLRSVDYAVETALRSIQAPSMEHADPEAELRPLQKQFEELFLAAYRGVMEDMLSMDEHRSTALMHLFMLEKAAYEVGYEASNRPQWLHVPLRGLHRLLQQLRKQ